MSGRPPNERPGGRPPGGRGGYVTTVDAGPTAPCLVPRRPRRLSKTERDRLCNLVEAAMHLGYDRMNLLGLQSTLHGFPVSEGKPERISD